MIRSYCNKLWYDETRQPFDGVIIGLNRKQKMASRLRPTQDGIRRPAVESGATRGKENPAEDEPREGNAKRADGSKKRSDESAARIGRQKK